MSDKDRRFVNENDAALRMLTVIQEVDKALDGDKKSIALCLGFALETVRQDSRLLSSAEDRETIKRLSDLVSAKVHKFKKEN